MPTKEKLPTFTSRQFPFIQKFNVLLLLREVVHFAE